jgi:hypothetical protein
VGDRPHLVDLLLHPAPVLDGSGVAQHALRSDDLVDVLVVADAADLDVHPRLALGALGGRQLVVRAGDRLEPTVRSRVTSNCG